MTPALPLLAQMQGAEPMAGALHLALALAVLAAATAALLSPRRMAAVVLFLIFGVLASAYWAAIGTPDVALAEAVIGTGVTGALFGFAATTLPKHLDAEPRSRWLPVPGAILGGALGAGLAAASTRAAAGADAPPGLTEEVAPVMPQTGVEHPITGVLLNLRSYDTLLEMVVLLVAATIALTFLPSPRRRRSPARSGATAPEHPATGPQRTTPLRLFIALTAPVVLLLAAWLLFAGSSQPGGAFQAGAAFAAMLILLDAAAVRPLRLSPAMMGLLVLGVTAFLAVGLGGAVLGDAWLHLRGPWAGPVTIALESALAVTIGASLALVHAGLSAGPAEKGESA